MAGPRSSRARCVGPSRLTPDGMSLRAGGPRGSEGRRDGGREASDRRSLLTQAQAQGAGDLLVEPKVVTGHAAAVLLEMTRPGDVLVVGSRGRGGFRGLLMGSTSSQCAQHATCPVVVVPDF